MDKLEETCPKCGGKGKYQKGWDMKQKSQKTGGTHGEHSDTGKIIRIRLYKCVNCKRLFRKGNTVKDGDVNNAKN